MKIRFQTIQDWYKLRFIRKKIQVKSYRTEIKVTTKNKGKKIVFFNYSQTLQDC